MSIAGVILAGGRSSRMGEPKEGVRMDDGRTMIEHVADALRPIVDSIMVVGDCTGFDPAKLDARHVLDLRKGEGPLAGIESALATESASHYLITTCDQPRLTSWLLLQLLPPGVDATILHAADEDLLPFPCLLSADHMPTIRAALDAGERSPSRWLRAQTLDRRSVDAAAVLQVKSINTAEELGRLTK